MLIYEKKNNEIIKLEKNEFESEKDLQNFVEKNMEKLFSIKFIKSEFQIDKYRFDSVGFNKDEDWNSFVIFEYKKSQNYSLIDQGYAYLSTALDRKSELILLYNEIFNKSLRVNDVNWENIRVYFVSPKFTIYQRDAVQETMPFELYEINQYSQNIITISKYNSNFYQKNGNNKFSNDTKNKVINKVNHEVKVYSETYFLNRLSSDMKDLYFELKTKISELPNVEFTPLKVYLAIKVNNHPLCSFAFSNNTIKIALSARTNEIEDYRKLVVDWSNIGHWGVGNAMFELTNEDDLEYAMFLIKQTYNLVTKDKK
ncbi:hypothetical protein MSATCC14277_0650 [Metamycoplasma salivarium]|uniref:hypothetical protein n=1 Tax=Metamycoplasma salivarium TaxID=2124 RepID=UPI001F2C8116|nr:hypothetical protein [Metamycoplasma salivarium]GIZ05483.1 hypothetical protein MSATCC14277_0650 [Metamycoplasma salivarium]